MAVDINYQGGGSSSAVVATFTGQKKSLNP